MNPFDKYNNQLDVVSLDKWLANQQSMNKGANQPKAQGKGNFLTHLIPTIGGTAGGVGGGAIGGALAGSAILPGVGTVAGGLLGALLGGAAGGATGKVVENKVEHQALGNGVVGQAAEQGLLSAGPVRLLKGVAAGGKALLGAGEAAAATTGAKAGTGSLVDAINAAGSGATTPLFKNVGKNLVTQGEQAQGRVAGVSAGSKVAGKELTPQDTQAMLSTLKTEGIKTGNANNALRDVQDKLNQYGQKIATHFETNNTPLKPGDTRALATDFVKSLKTSDPTILKQAKILSTDLKNNVSDTKSLWEFRKSLDTKIPDAKMGTDNVTTAKVTALKALRQNISDKLGDVPGASNYHNLSEVKPFISAEAKRLNNPGGGITGRLAASGPFQKTEAALGKVAEKTGNALSGTANPVGIKAIASRTLPIGALQAGAQSMAATPNQTNTAIPASTSISNTNIDPLSQTSQDLSSTAADQGSPYSRDNLISDIQRDPKNADKYISTFNSLDQIFKASAPAKLNSTQQQQSFNAQSGLQSIAKIADTLQSNPNAAKLSSLPGGSITANLTGTGEYKAAINNAVDVIGRLRSGGAIGQQEQKNFLALLPQTGDNQQTIAYKLNQLASVFQNFANPRAADSTNPTDLASALQASGQYQ